MPSSSTHWNRSRVFRVTKSAIVMIVLLVVLVLGAVWGMVNVLAPQEEPEAGNCTTYPARKLQTADVDVSISNGGSIHNLARDVAGNLGARNFSGLAIGSADEDVSDTIVRGLNDDPAVKLVAAFFPGSTVEVDNSMKPHHVEVLVGDKFRPMNMSAPTSIDGKAIVVCSPTPTPTAPGTAPAPTEILSADPTRTKG